MTSCTIIISHFEAPIFLKTAIRKIREFAHPEIKQKILIIDQSKIEDHFNIFIDYASNPDVDILHTPSLWSGYGIDYAFRNYEFKTEYIAQLHVDAFPIHKNWLKLPITLIEENDLSFVGQLQFIGKGTESIYPPNPFFCMAQCFNVAKTETYREMSIEAGFTRFHNRQQSQLGFNNHDWWEWAKEDYGSRGSDDDVVAFHWEDTHREHNKLGLAITGFIGPQYGRIIEDIVFHFGSANEARGVMDKMPKKYREYTERIKQDYSDELIDEMVKIASESMPYELEILSRNLWNGTTKTVSSATEELNKRIEWLKQ